MPELPVGVLVQEVLDRNPTLAQMVAAWQAAEARYPQAKALEDPMLNTRVGPAAFGSNKVDGAFMVELSQKLPFPGKRDLRGENALAEASAAGHEVEDTRLQLIESAQTAYFDYFLAERALEVNRRNLDLLQRMRKSAVSRYESGKTPTRQELLQADVEIGREQDRRLALEQAHEVAIARLNTLMHLPPDSPLPPSPRQLRLGTKLPDASSLRTAALARRPDLRSAADRVRAEQASLALAEREFYPDVEVMAAYDAFWQERPLRPQVGLKLNLPVYKAKRSAASTRPVPASSAARQSGTGWLTGSTSRYRKRIPRSGDPSRACASTSRPSCPRHGRIRRRQSWPTGRP
jgi:outer membrane protein TolC